MDDANHFYLFQRSYDDCLLKIQNGTFLPGDSFYSCAELCHRYGLTLVQARKIQHALFARRYITRSHGSRFLVLPRNNAQPVVALPGVKRIRVIGDVSSICEGSYGGRIVEGVQEGCQTHGLEFRRDVVRILNNPPGYLNTHLTLEKDEGLVVMLHHGMEREVIRPLLNHDTPVVTVNSFFFLRTAVAPDYRLAMKELLTHAVSRGARRVLYCFGYGLCPCPIIASERETAFLEYSEALGLEAKTEPSGNYHLAARMVAQFQPDTILYMNDNHAIQFRTYYLPQCGIQARVLGCDNFADGPGLETLTTWDTQPKEMGRQAVETLLHSCTTTKPFIVRLKGHLVIRD